MVLNNGSCIYSKLDLAGLMTRNHTARRSALTCVLSKTCVQAAHCLVGFLAALRSIHNMAVPNRQQPPPPPKKTSMNECSTLMEAEEVGYIPIAVLVYH